MDVENVSVDKKWILQYLAPKEKKILIFYCHFKDFLNKFLLYKCFVNFTGLVAYPKYFYVTIDKIEYYVNLMKDANDKLDFAKLSDLKSGKVKCTFQPRKSTTFVPISLQEVSEKYPEQLVKIENIIRNKNKRFWRKDGLNQFKWFIVNRKPDIFELACKKGTKFTLFEVIDEKVSDYKT